MAFAPREVLAIRLYEQQRHQVPDLSRFLDGFNGSYSNFRVVHRKSDTRLTLFGYLAIGAAPKQPPAPRIAIPESGPLQSPLDWPQD